MKPEERQQIEMYRRMMRIRLFEECVVKWRAEIPGSIHTSVGMEASVVGTCMALRDDDYILGTHRSHGHPIGKGAAIDPLMAELLGKKTGINRGKGGSMHLSDFSIGSLGETSIVGSGLPVATGAALGAKMQGSDRVTVCFFGDGAAAQGTFHESLNLASIWQLPVVYVCENNAYGELTAFEYACSAPSIASRAEGYNMPGLTVDGQDVIAVYEAVSESVARARSAGGPSLVETKTYRLYGHNGGPDPDAVYRTAEEVKSWWERDPIRLFGDALAERGVLSADALREIDEEEQRNVDRAWEFAKASDYPDPDEAFEHVFTNPIPEARPET